MQIHDLNTKALTNPAYVAFDDGTDTYKTEFNDCVENAANAAVAAADLTQNTVGFTSGDSLSPSGWTSVSQITTDSTLATLFNRISTMVKNVRYIWNLLGSSSFSNVASTLTGAIGNTALTTTAKTLSGAIAEHESDISTLNSKFVSGGLFRIETISEKYSKPVSSAGGVMFTIPTKNDYTPIGIVGCYAGSNHVVIYEWRLTSNTTARLMLQGDSSAATQITATINVLYIRNS